MSMLLQLPQQHFKVGGQSFDFPEIQIERQELVGLIGQTGSGKSILLRQLAGLMDSTKSLQFFGKQRAFIFSRGGTFQHHSIRENLHMAALFAKQTTSSTDIDAVLKDWNLTGVQDKYPPQLSAQALKITQIARAVLLKPDLLFVEKPLMGLSVHQADQFIDWIQHHIKHGGSLVYSEESTRVFHPLNPRKIMLGGGNDNLRTVMHNH